MKEKFRERKIKVFLGENLKCGILLSSCALVGFYVNLQVKVTEKFDENFQSVFRVSFEIKVAGKKKLTLKMFGLWVFP